LAFLRDACFNRFVLSQKDIPDELNDVRGFGESLHPANLSSSSPSNEMSIFGNPF